VSSAKLARGVHATRAPEVRAQILAGALHRVPCASCGATIDVQRDFVFTDFKRGDWVRIATPMSLARWSAVEQETVAQFDRVMTFGAPVVAELAGRFRIRVVFDVDELRERFLIWDAGLDDAVVECAKLSCVHERPDLARRGHRLRVRTVEASGDLVVACVPAERPSADVARWTVPAHVVTQVRTERAAWQARNPELFDRAFVSLDRYLVAG
jgi:hypothetical protein